MKFFKKYKKCDIIKILPDKKNAIVDGHNLHYKTVKSSPKVGSILLHSNVLRGHVNFLKHVCSKVDIVQFERWSMRSKFLNVSS